MKAPRTQEQIAALLQLQQALYDRILSSERSNLTEVKLKKSEYAVFAALAEQANIRFMRVKNYNQFSVGIDKFYLHVCRNYASGNCQIKITRFVPAHEFTHEADIPQCGPKYRKGQLVYVHVYTLEDSVSLGEHVAQVQEAQYNYATKEWMYYVLFQYKDVRDNEAFSPFIYYAESMLTFHTRL